MLYFDRSTLAAYNKRFLAESKGKVTHLELDCLKPHIGNSNIMDEYPEDQNDIYTFKFSDIFLGPIVIEPYPKRKWKVEDLKKIKDFYDKVKGIYRYIHYL